MPEERQYKQAKEVFRSLCAAFDADGWTYDADEKELTIESGVQGEDLPIPIDIEVDAERMLVSLISRLPFCVEKERRREMAVAVSRANNGLVDGSFDYDYNTGDILFRITVSFLDSLIAANALRSMVHFACFAVDAYNDKFLQVNGNDMDCDEVADFIA